MFNLSKQSRRRKYLIYLTLVVLVLGIGVPWSYNAYEFREYYNLRHQVKETILSQANLPPPELDQRTWEQGVVIDTHDAFGTIFFNPQCATFDELKSFVRDFEAQSQLSSVERIRWTWLRLEKVKSRHTETQLRNRRLLMGDLARYTVTAKTLNE